MSRRFHSGQRGEIGGVDYRVVTGRKRERDGRIVDDLRLEVRAMEFTPVKMALGCLEAEFYYENENELYPKKLGFEGGERYLNYVRAAAFIGWEAVAEQIAAERAARARRLDV